MMHDKPNCNYCNKQSTRVLRNGAYLCDELDCWAEEIHDSTRDNWGDEE